MEVISFFLQIKWINWTVVRASALQVGRPRLHSPCRVIPKDFKNGIVPAWHLAFRGGCEEQVGKFACCVVGQGA